MNRHLSSGQSIFAECHSDVKSVLLIPVLGDIAMI